MFRQLPGFYAGVSSIQERNDFIKKNILFLKLFIKEQEKKRTKLEAIKQYWDDNNKTKEIALEKSIDNTWLNQSKGIEKVKLEVQEIKLVKLKTEIDIKTIY